MFSEGEDNELESQISKLSLVESPTISGESREVSEVSEVQQHKTLTISSESREISELYEIPSTTSNESKLFL
ncbi:24635_t:CDS:2 [Dentiscutata erythropus]|uniref:24635_t:CDS:1 n=1 Tax=Dentiscutata erythropus TaxID=1348616 RepID=A0A9N9HF79_9GLOM|nr:24635_t:CDS:2 [Dentiscutata erythropus]